MVDSRAEYLGKNIPLPTHFIFPSMVAADTSPYLPRVTQKCNRLGAHPNGWLAAQAETQIIERGRNLVRVRCECGTSLHLLPALVVRVAANCLEEDLWGAACVPPFWG